MKRFAVGDGNIFMTCPDRFCADLDGQGGCLVWDPAHEEVIIHLQVARVRRTDGQPDDEDGSFGFWRVIEIAREKGEKPVKRGNAVIVVRTLERIVKDGHCLYFRDAGIGNYIAMYSFTLPEAQDGTPIALQTDAELFEMMASLVERKPSERVFSDLLEGDRARIEDAVESLLSKVAPDQRWDTLQTAYLCALGAADDDLASSVGLALAELLREEVPTLDWTIQVDDDGRSLALQLGDSGIAMHPETIVVKQMERKNRVNLRILADQTLAAMEEMFRAQSSGESDE